MAGSGGFIGRFVCSELERNGYQVIPIPREIALSGGDELTRMIQQADVVINLAGENIFGRWTVRKRDQILTSRQIVTRNLSLAIRSVSSPPGVWINASAVGIYKNGCTCDEFSTDFDSGFLSQVVQRWEHEVVLPKGTRKVILRFGVVLGENGGVIRKLKPFQRLGFAFIMGNGRQAFPTVHVKDITGFIAYAIKHDKIKGVYNLVTPISNTYKEFIREYSRVFRVHWIIRIPEWVLQGVLGDVSSMLTKSAIVIPCRWEQSGYRIQFSTVKAILEDIE